jgi:hypothetical protein
MTLQGITVGRLDSTVSAIDCPATAFGVFSSRPTVKNLSGSQARIHIAGRSWRLLQGGSVNSRPAHVFVHEENGRRHRIQHHLQQGVIGRPK